LRGGILTYGDEGKSFYLGTFHGNKILPLTTLKRINSDRKGLTVFIITFLSFYPFYGAIIAKSSFFVATIKLGQGLQSHMQRVRYQSINRFL